MHCSPCWWLLPQRVMRVQPLTAARTWPHDGVKPEAQKKEETTFCFHCWWRCNCTVCSPYICVICGAYKSVLLLLKYSSSKNVFPQGVVWDAHCVKGNGEAKSNQPPATMCWNHIMHIVRCNRGLKLHHIYKFITNLRFWLLSLFQRHCEQEMHGTITL